MIQLTQWAYAVFCIINFNYLRWNVIWGCASEWVEVSKCVLEERARIQCAMNALKKKKKRCAVEEIEGVSYVAV